MADAPHAEKKGMDPVKAYCLVLGFLVVVLGYLCFSIRGTRQDYATANERAESLLTGKGLTSTDGRPSSIPDIAYEVEKYVKTYKATAPEGAGTTGIPIELMRRMSTAVNMEWETANVERVDTNRARKFETRSRQFDYKAATLAQIINLVWNIENNGRFRVNEIRWQLGDKKENAAPPFHRVPRPSVKVAVRTPIAGGE